MAAENMRNANNLGLLIMFISFAGVLVAIASLMEHAFFDHCLALMTFPEQVICKSLFGRILPDILLMCPNLVGLLVGYWIYTQSPNRKLNIGVNHGVAQ